MSRTRRSAIIAPFILFAANVAYAQDGGAPAGGAPAGGGDAPSDGGAGATNPPGGEPSPTTPYVPNTGAGSAGSGAMDVNAGLDAGSRPAAAGAVGRDGFTFGTTSSGATIRGGAGGAYVVSGQYVPELHTAKRGDTLSEISQRYFGNTYNWPRLWSYNRQIQNPHWIYPGDHIRLREPFVQQSSVVTVGVARLNPRVPPATIFQRHVGFLLDGKTPAWGEVVGSPGDRMILAEQDAVYVQLVGDRDYKVGQKLIVFEPRQVDAGTEYPLVWIRGIVEIDRINPKTKMARARVLESMSEIHRGCKVAPYERNLDTLTPVANKKTLQARIVGSTYPHEFYGANQVVFIDKGTLDGVEVGNRFVAVQRADSWRRDLPSAGPLGNERSIVEDDRPARVEKAPDAPSVEDFPAETYAELIVTRVRERSATCLVTASNREIPRDATLLAREGY